VSDGERYRRYFHRVTVRERERVRSIESWRVIGIAIESLRERERESQ